MSLSEERLALPPFEAMTEAQRIAANDLIAGPRKGVKGPFIPLLRSPELMSRLQKVGEYLRFHSSLAPRISELATLCVARSWSQQFEWVIHVPLALKAGTSKETIAAIRDGRRPSTMQPACACIACRCCRIAFAKRSLRAERSHERRTDAERRRAHRRHRAL